MSKEHGGRDISFLASESLASQQYTFVSLASSTTVQIMNSGSADAIGILQNAPASGEVANVRVEGTSKLAVNAAIAINKVLKPEYVGAADAGKGQDAGADGKYARAYSLEASGAEDDVIEVLLLGPQPKSLGTVIGKTTVTTDATAGASTYTAAELLGGLILRDPAGAARSDVTPTALLIVAAIDQPAIGSSFEFTIENQADAAETITVTAGTDVTLVGTMTIAQNNSKRFLAVVTALTTVSIYSLGTVVT